MFYLRLLLNVLNFAGNVHSLDITVYIFLCVKETYYITFLTFFAIQEWPDSFFFLSKPMQKHTCIILLQYKINFIICDYRYGAAREH